MAQPDVDRGKRHYIGACGPEGCPPLCLVPSYAGDLPCRVAREPCVCLRAHLWGHTGKQWGREVWSMSRGTWTGDTLLGQATLAILCTWHDEVTSRNRPFCVPRTSVYSLAPVVFFYLNCRIAAVLFSLFCRQIVCIPPTVWVKLTLEAMLGT